MATILRFGGGGTDVSAATATAAQVISGQTFFGSGSEDIQTGTLAFSGDAEEANVLATKTFYNNSVTKRTGTMPARTGTTETLGYGNNVSVASGYYATAFTITAPSRYGNATAGQVLNGYTFMNSTANSTGTIPSRTGTTKTMTSAEAVTIASGYYATAFTLTAPTVPAITGNATNAQVLSGATFMNSSGTQQTGTIPSQSITNVTLGYGNSQSGSAGHYASAFTITAPGRYGDATAGEVLAGKTFMNSTTNSTGTMANNGDGSRAINCKVAGGVATSGITAGYYSGGTITATGYKVYFADNEYIQSSWLTRDLGFTPSYAVVGYNGTWDSGTRPGIKHYVSGNSVVYCINASGNQGYTARIMAYA